ncbi:MAG: metallophosphoesterase family protein [Bacilli bacterium]|nr:metallophosphoesterase family protein [Bacilli bacterium]
MIKKVIACSDIHIRNFQRLEEYADTLTIFIEKCREIASKYEKEEVRIVICGDIIHNKNNISPELISFTSNFLRQLEEIAKVIVIAGNHDLIVNNLSRKDAITSIFETANFSNTFLLDNILGYESGYVIDDNITWAVYSIYDNFMKPNIEEAREEYPDNKIVGLYHGVIVGSTLDNGVVMDDGIDRGVFVGCDCVMCGDIHKRQVLRKNGIDIVYSGSLIQQTFGETVTQHGFTVWDMETLEHEFVDIETEYGLYSFEIDNFDDIDNDKERLKNL